MNRKNNLKLQMARDVILAYLMKEDFTVAEAETVLQMAQKEIEAWETRQTFQTVSEGE